MIDEEPENEIPNDPNLSTEDIGTGVEFQGADLSDSRLYCVDPSAAFLKEANLTEANLNEADLTNADLREATFVDVHLSADLSIVDLTDADLSGATLTDTNLTGAALKDAIITDKQLEEAPVIAGETLFSCYKRRLYAVESSSGDEEWESNCVEIPTQHQRSAMRLFLLRVTTSICTRLRPEHKRESHFRDNKTSGTFSSHLI